MTESSFWKSVKNLAEAGKRAVLTVVFDAKESTPGKQGFKMIVDEDGGIKGSIGGGVMEHEVIKECLEILGRPAAENHFRRYNHYGDTPDSTGMICCGSQVIGFAEIGKKDLSVLTEVEEAAEKNSGGVATISRTNFIFSKREKQAKKFNFDEEEWKYSEVVGLKERVYIFGGGHVGLSISRIMSLLDFRVTVIEKRREIFTLADNNFADEIINEDYVKYSDKIIEDEFSYVVIVTPSHSHDKEVLRAVIGKKVRYIGMMGSKAKVKTVIGELGGEGIPEELLSKVHSPIGLPINSRTPDEIAVSIAAEIINVKNSMFF